MPPTYPAASENETLIPRASCAVCGAPALLPAGSSVCGLCAAQNEIPARPAQDRLFTPIQTMPGQTGLNL
jgi:hypothetical protein